MPNTTVGLPYPAPTDPIAAGATAIQSLAESIQGGRASIAVASNAVQGSLTITFPKPFASPPPIVGACTVDAQWFNASVALVTATNMLVWVRHTDNQQGAVSVGISWYALGDLA